MRIKDSTIEPFFIDVDDNNFIVKDTYVSEGEKTKGQEIETVIGYHMTMENALHRIIRLKVTRNEGVIDLNEYLTRYESISKEVFNAIKHITDAKIKEK